MKEIKKSGFLYKHRFALIFFLWAVLYNFLVVNGCRFWRVSVTTYCYHIVDYKSLGFRAQVLPGTVFWSIFGEHANETVASVYETALMLLLFAGVAFLLERFLNSVGGKDKTAALVLIGFYLSGSFTFAIFTEELGMLDSYWIYFSLLFFLFIKNRFLRFLVPVLFGLSMLIHFSATLTYPIMFAILLLYLASGEKEPKKRAVWLIILFLCAAITVALLGFFLLSQTKNIPLTMEEFHKLLNERGSDYYIYYDYSFYNWYLGREVIPAEVYERSSFFARIVGVVVEKGLSNIRAYREELPKVIARVVLSVAILSPAFLFYYKHISELFRSSKGLRRFSLFLMMVQPPFTMILGCLFSPDVIRWATHTFLIAFTTLLFVMYREEDLRRRALEDLRQKFSVPLLVYGLAYFLAPCQPY